MILIMGMPGAGKSVQSELIRDRLGFHWLSTGELFRETNDPEIKEIMASGALVDDEQTCRLVGYKLKHVGYDSTFLLDGFPRAATPAKWLIEHGEEIDKHIKLVLYLDIGEEAAMERLGQRGRDDDDAEALRKRREEAMKIMPAIDYLQERGIPLEKIDAFDTVENVFAEVKAAIEKYI